MKKIFAVLSIGSVSAAEIFILEHHLVSIANNMDRLVSQLHQARNLLAEYQILGSKLTDLCMQFKKSILNKDLLSQAAIWQELSQTAQQAWHFYIQNLKGFIETARNIKDHLDSDDLIAKAEQFLKEYEWVEEGFDEARTYVKWRSLSLKELDQSVNSIQDRMATMLSDTTPENIVRVNKKAIFESYCRINREIQWYKDHERLAQYDQQYATMMQKVDINSMEVDSLRHQLTQITNRLSTHFSDYDEMTRCILDPAYQFMGSPEARPDFFEHELEEIKRAQQPKQKGA